MLCFRWSSVYLVRKCIRMICFHQHFCGYKGFLDVKRLKISRKQMINYNTNCFYIFLRTFQMNSVNEIDFVFGNFMCHSDTIIVLINSYWTVKGLLTGKRLIFSTFPNKIWFFSNFSIFVKSRVLLRDVENEHLDRFYAFWINASVDSFHMNFKYLIPF